MGTFFYGELARYGLAKAIFVLIHTFLQSDSFFEIGFCYALVKIPDRKQSILTVHYLDCRAQSSLQQFFKFERGILHQAYLAQSISIMQICVYLSLRKEANDACNIGHGHRPIC